MIRILIALKQGDISDLGGASRKRVNPTMVLFKEWGLIITDAEGRNAIRDSQGPARNDMLNGIIAP